MSCCDPSAPLRKPADAVAAGVSASALRGKNFRKIFHGIYVHASVPAHPLVRVEAALALHPPGAFASHLSAARVYDVPLPALPDEHVSVFAPGDRRRRPGIRTHVAPEDTPVAEVRGVRVSAVLQMFVELGEVLGLVDLVVVGDWLVRQRRVSPDELVAFSESAGHVGARAARRAAAYVRRDVDSPMRVEAALRARGGVLPRRLSDDWRPHFPAR